MSKPDDHYELISPTAWAVAHSITFSDIPFAKEIFEAIEKNETTNGNTSKFTELRLGEVAPTYEARYKLVNHLLEQSKEIQILEIASGLCPRGISMTTKTNIRYVEMDLPEVIAQKMAILQSVAVQLPANLHLEPGNALEPKDLQSASRHFDTAQEIAVINEGLLRYLTFDEKAKVAKNVHSLLQKFGGVWITPDITLKSGLARENRAVCIVKNTKQMTGIDIQQNAFENVEQAKKFFEQFGFTIEIHSFLEIEKELVSPAKLNLSAAKVKDLIGQWVVFVMKITK
ncbi:MAG: class I SAM-dependent methyltransferase [Candidatus Diapherotrites archaeon]|uniref:Class I SAM-dependent methyltransferase n=1 Tax=Candidatus Iainarchaeum sp. TaxID=3101447 RepID=A0A8T4L4N0_9ARCH|nr:class I SAM-dependent methyltransferase [Candidatus Diapherotrites archaeon]